MFLSGSDELPKGLFEAACALNAASPILLIGAFVPKPDYRDMLWYYAGGAEALILNRSDAVAGDAGEDDLPERAIAQFEDRCQRNGIEYRIHQLSGQNLLHAIRKESRFADLLMMSNVPSENQDLETVLHATHNTVDSLHCSECPVLIVPVDYQEFESVILAYDGTPDSVFAIKHLACVLPHLATLDTLLVNMHHDGNKELPDHEYIHTLAARHFENLTVFKVGIDPRSHFDSWLSNAPKALVVMGAFGRNAVSRMLHPSFADGILKAHQTPVFIAHR